ncbi:MAG TPA: hypothetical protein VE078_15095 [Thermoanaerobaculia bacterium]|nr:hypothetical protein [Thermoanaerobaculia bacterium]
MNEPPLPILAAEAPREAEELYIELLALPPVSRRRALRQSRFQNPALLDLLLDGAEDAGRRGAFHLADELARFSSDLVYLVEAEESWFEIRRSRAFCLMGNARRIAGDFAAAEDAFGEAAKCQAGGLEQAACCRGMALVCWETCLHAFAAALLGQAAKLFWVRRQRHEAGACLTLLGMLYLEEGSFEKALRPLLRGRRLLNPEARPWLTVRCFLSSALALAVSGRTGEAREALEHSAPFYSLVYETEEKETSVIPWLEGRIASYLGDLEHARDRLETARERFLGERRYAEAGAATLDLVAIYTELGSDPKVDEVIEELRWAFPHSLIWPAEPLFDVVARFKDIVAPPRARAAVLSAKLFHLARLLHRSLWPLPWV